MPVTSARPAVQRPMPFGKVGSGSVRDPIIEPLWVGRRVLAHLVLGEQAKLTDQTGEDIVEVNALREEIAAANLASTLIVDGYLTASIRDSTGIQAPDVTEGLVTPGQLGRQMILGGGGSSQDARRDQAEASLLSRAPAPAEEEAGFVAIDLLELDGESLLDVPLLERKRLLESVFGESARVRLSPFVRPPPSRWYAQWRAMGFREMAFKAANGRYTPGVVSRDWAIVQIPRR